MVTPPEAPKCIECGSERVVTDLGAMNGACPDCGNGRNAKYTLPPEASPVPCALCNAEPRHLHAEKFVVPQGCRGNRCPNFEVEMYPVEWNALQSAIHAHAERAKRAATVILEGTLEGVDAATASAVSEATKPLTNALIPLVRRMKAMTDYADCECPPEGHFCGITQAREELREAQVALAAVAGSGEGEKCLAHEVCRGTSMRVRGCDCEACSPAPSGAAKEGS